MTMMTFLWVLLALVGFAALALFAVAAWVRSRIDLNDFRYDDGEEDEDGGF